MTPIPGAANQAAAAGVVYFDQFMQAPHFVSMADGYNEYEGKYIRQKTGLRKN